MTGQKNLKRAKLILSLPSFRVMLILLTLGSFLALYNYPGLPDIIPHHFDFKGRPDAWGSKAFFVGFMLGISAFLLLSVYGTAWTILLLGEDHISLPHKEYWLAPERKEATLRNLLNTLGWIGVCTLLLILVLMWMTIRAAKETPSDQRLIGFWPVFIGYLVSVIFLVIRFMLHYQRLPTNHVAGK